MVHNTNAITKHADMNQIVDETTWGHAGFGEVGSGLTGRLIGKKVPKGGQTVVISDSRRFRPRAYMHRHKLHKKPEGNTKMGTVELHYVATKLLKMVITDEPGQVGTKKIFKKKPCITADNYFIDDTVLNWAGKKGLGIIGTNARNVLPKVINGEYLQVGKTKGGDPYSKVARFTNPIIAVKNADGYQRVHISFQSTSSTNIATVNVLNECNLFVEIRERGRQENKQYWGIEMNDARRLYLSTYFRIDVVDHLLKNAAIFYRTWKYWHVPKNHAIALVIVLAFGIYEECCEGKIEPLWEIDAKIRLTYFQFREILSTQMLVYSPKRMNYPGDEYMRAVTSNTRVNHGGKRKEIEGVTAKQFRSAKRYSSSRLCGDLDNICTHAKNIKRLDKPRMCAWCGTKTYTVCGVCRDEKTRKHVPLHYNAKKGKGKNEMCVYDYHNNLMFGLGKNDSTRLLHGVKGDWEKPTKDMMDDNAKHIKSLL